MEAEFSIHTENQFLKKKKKKKPFQVQEGFKAELDTSVLHTQVENGQRMLTSKGTVFTRGLLGWIKDVRQTKMNLRAFNVNCEVNLHYFFKDLFRVEQSHSLLNFVAMYISQIQFSLYFEWTKLETFPSQWRTQTNIFVTLSKMPSCVLKQHGKLV